MNVLENNLDNLNILKRLIMLCESRTIEHGKACTTIILTFRLAKEYVPAASQSILITQKNCAETYRVWFLGRLTCKGD